MLTFKYVYDSQRPDAFKDALSTMNGYVFNFETYDVNHYKERKKAFKIKGSCSARENPFLAVYDDNDTLIKAFYTEAGECNANHVHTWLQDYFATNGKRAL